MAKPSNDDRHGRVLSWLYGVATNVLRNEHRSLRRHRDAVAHMRVEVAEASFAARTDERLDDEPRVRRMLELIKGLPRRERELVVLCWWSGLTYEQAAEALDIPVGTVRSRLSSARARLLRAAEGQLQVAHGRGDV